MKFRQTSEGKDNAAEKMKDRIRASLIDTGAAAVGFARADEVEPSVTENFHNWIEEGCHAGMEYLNRHLTLRQHTDSVLPGARTVISLAYSYYPLNWRAEGMSSIAAYAYGEDYHTVLRETLHPVVKTLQKEYGGKWRICIDSAPVAERYWALKSGIGKGGKNGCVIIDGCGSFSFLVEILTTLEIPSDSASDEVCENCGRCLEVCPTGALRQDGTLDARRCINYLTIEKKGDFTQEEEKLIVMHEGYLFGCDKCLRVCPHNSNSDKKAPNLFSSKREILELTPEEMIKTDPENFRKHFGQTPLNYAGIEKLQRNARTLLKNKLETNDFQPLSLSRGDKIRTCDHTPPRRC